MRYVLAVLAAVLAVDTLSAQQKPNIVLIVSDDQGWTDYGLMGHPYIRTLHLDKLAEQSLVFHRGYSVTSVCCPSLASILTGQSPHRTEICNNDPPKRGKTAKALADDAEYAAARRRMVAKMEKLPTVPRSLAEQGLRELPDGQVGDDMGYCDVGSHNCKDIPTPNLDALAKAGVRFTSGCVSGPYRSPTRAGLLTGRYQTRFGHEFDDGGAGGGLPVAETTLADRLKASGYATGLVGK